MFNFDNSKQVFLSKKDKSSIQRIDLPIKNLCEKINQKKDYFTTSSCSGRIVLIKDETKKQPGLFLFRSHKKITIEELKHSLENIKNKNKSLILFKQEPCLLVVSCRNKTAQWKLFQLSRNNGWKKSGILSIDKKLLIELFSTENISFPIVEKNNLLVDGNFLNIIVKKANENLEKCWDKIKRLENLLESL